MHGGGLAVDGRTVVCNVYALTPRLNSACRVGSLKRSRWGIYHTGIEVYGTEYSFGGHAGSSTGVSAGTPRKVSGARFVTSIPLGVCAHDVFELRSLLADVATEWTGRDYHPLDRNCNHFSGALSSLLKCSPPPPWVNAFSTACIVRTLLPLAERVARWVRIAPVQQVEETPGGEGSSTGSDQRHGSGMLAVLLDAAKNQKLKGNGLYSAGAGRHYRE